MEREESDQLPEEGPEEQVPDDTGAGDAREEADEHEPPEDDGQATGHPGNAG